METKATMNRITVALLVLALAACGGTKKASSDAADATDVGGEADAATDAVPDADPDAETDPSPDEGTDVPVDAPGEVETDAGEDPAVDPEDDGPEPSVDCDGEICSSTEICCFVASTGSSGESCTSPEACTGAEIACDGPEDCDPGEVCCHGPPDWGAECVPSSSCGSSGSGLIICADAGDCPTATPACCSVMGGIWSVCRPSCG